MFTVLHRKSDGSETLYEAETITRGQPEGEECVPARGRFSLSGAKCDGVPLGADILLDIEAPFGAIFVMNEAGATVARYMAEPRPVS